MSMAGLSDWGLAGDRMQQQPRLMDSLLDYIQEHSPALHPFDSFAIRTLLLHQPQRIHKLSSLQLGRGRFVQRVLVEGATGEESVLTLTLGEVQAPAKRGGGSALHAPTDRDEPPSPGADMGEHVLGGWAVARDHTSRKTSGGGGGDSSATASGCPSGNGSMRTERKWRLVRVRGEPRIGSLPAALSPEFCPEAIVESQLDALQVGWGPFLCASGGAGAFFVRFRWAGACLRFAPQCACLLHSAIVPAPNRGDLKPGAPMWCDLTECTLTPTYACTHRHTLMHT